MTWTAFAIFAMFTGLNSLAVPKNGQIRGMSRPVKVHQKVQQNSQNWAKKDLSILKSTPA